MSESMITPEMIEAAAPFHCFARMTPAKLCHEICDQCKRDAEAALTGALSLASLPVDKGEIGELIATLNQWVEALRTKTISEYTISDIALFNGGCVTEDIEKAATALRSLVLEVDARKRIAELEAALAAVRNKTIEECARAAFAAVREDDDGGSRDFDLGFHAGRCNAGEAIRALATGETK